LRYAIAATATMEMTASPRRSRFALYLDLIRWNRPAGTLLLLWPTLAALWIAAGAWSWQLRPVPSTHRQPSRG